MQVRVNISYISAERFWEQDKPAPTGVHISTNVNIIGLDRREDKLAAPFVVTIVYNPPLAQINIKGQALILGDPGEIEKIYEGYKKQSPPPQLLLQAITNTSLVEATVVSRSLNIPPPIPMPSLQPPQKEDRERPSYVG
ncbi:MAG: hypothetical protein APZ16_03555 [Candidatus Hadarchaeum yellowstonense]|uniref:Uncharacterized protein n=1 Tax=Hadarchaeum yellowstonense TaxID=1776334 RepID=A0A147JZV8_HADYE|nr:MAG: hypothetical protein APZ16_03555 [Candidatus Hadarchaeum yellowstonense]